MRSRAQIATTDAHRRTVQTSTAAIAQALELLLGRVLVAHMAGVTDPKAVGRWGRGERHPRPAAEGRLRAAYQALQLLLGEDQDPDVARAWFIGLNPHIADRAPAEAIAGGDLRAALAAARSYGGG